MTDSTQTDKSVVSVLDIVNGGDCTIFIGARPEELDIVLSFDLITERYLDVELLKSNNRITEPVKQWLTRNFVGWLRSGLPNSEKLFALPSDYIKFRDQMYAPLSVYINDLVTTMAAEKITKEWVIEQFPPFVKGNIEKQILFCGGRLFRLGHVFNHRNFAILNMENLLDYLITCELVSETPNDNLMPHQYHVRKMHNLSPVDAFIKAKEWHDWVEKNKDRVSKAEMAATLNTLKLGSDLVEEIKFENGAMAVRLQTRISAEVEGKAMKHCVGGYGRSIEDGTTTISSIRDEDGYPQVTIEWDPKEKTVKQIKGHSNGKVKEPYHRNVHDWLIHHGIQRANDIHNVNLESITSLYETREKEKRNEKANLFDNTKSALSAFMKK